MTEREALLRAVCENPDEDTPRLVFADWLDENGEPERAEFIRVQIELPHSTGKKASRLKQREEELLAVNAEEWAEPFMRFDLASSSSQHVHDIHYRRGFVHAVELDDEDDRFADYAAELFQLAPIRRLVFVLKHRHEKSSCCPELLRLTELSTDRAGFEADELQFLFASPYLRNLSHLELIADDDNAHLDRDGLELLGRATGLSSLRHVNISGNWCHWWGQDEAWVSSLLAGPLVSQFESIRLCSTFLNSTGAEAIANCERLASLTHLAISDNSINDRALQAIAESPHLARLKVLEARYNRSEGENGEEIPGCRPETRRLLEARFGSGLLMDDELR